MYVSDDKLMAGSSDLSLLVNTNYVIYVTSGLSENGGCGTANRVKYVDTFEKYQPGTRGYPGDVGIITLEEKVIFSEHVSSIQWKESFDREKIMISTMTGWSCIYGHDKPCVDRKNLKSLLVTVISHDSCLSSFTDFLVDPEYHFCAISLNLNKENVSPGDSGSPLIHRGQILGIVAYSAKHTQSQPILFTKISAPPIVKFIKHIISRPILWDRPRQKQNSSTYIPYQYPIRQ